MGFASKFWLLLLLLNGGTPHSSFDLLSSSLFLLDNLFLKEYSKSNSPFPPRPSRTIFSMFNFLFSHCLFGQNVLSPIPFSSLSLLGQIFLSPTVVYSKMFQDISISCLSCKFTSNPLKVFQKNSILVSAANSLYFSWNTQTQLHFLSQPQIRFESSKTFLDNFIACLSSEFTSVLQEYSRTIPIPGSVANSLQFFSNFPKQLYYVCQSQFPFLNLSQVRFKQEESQKQRSDHLSQLSLVTNFVKQFASPDWLHLTDYIYLANLTKFFKIQMKNSLVTQQ